jgi:hypothetical protein
MFNKLIRVAGLALVGGLLSASSAFAASVTIVEVHLGGVGQPDLQFVSGVLSTVNDGDAATPGDQNTDVFFDSLLDSVADIISGASFTLAGVGASGTPVVSAAGISQHTSGGTFNLYGEDAAHTLLLSGTLGDGEIVGADSSSIGSFFTTQIGSLTGGSLLGLLPANIPVLIGFSLGSLTSADGSGLDVINTVNGPALGDFTANGTGLIDVVPEPASFALLLSGLLGGVAARRRKLS